MVQWTIPGCDLIPFRPALNRAHNGRLGLRTIADLGMADCKNQDLWKNGSSWRSIRMDRIMACVVHPMFVIVGEA